MSEELVKVTERIYSNDPERPRYVIAYEGSMVKRSVLEALGYAVPKAEAKRRPKSAVEDKAIKPASKSAE